MKLTTEKALLVTFTAARWDRAKRSPLILRLLYSGMSHRLEKVGVDPIIPVQYDHNEWPARHIHEVMAYGFAP